MPNIATIPVGPPSYAVAVQQQRQTMLEQLEQESRSCLITIDNQAVEIAALRTRNNDLTADVKLARQRNYDDRLFLSTVIVVFGLILIVLLSYFIYLQVNKAIN